MTGSWYDTLHASAAGCASQALQLGEQAGATLGGALARLQSLPVEAAAAVAELTSALEGMLGRDARDLVALPAPPATGPGSLALPGPDGGFGGTARVVPQAVPRRLVVDAAAFGRFIRAQHPSKPAVNAAAFTGIAVDTMEKMLARETLPNGPNFILCVMAYGPAILAAVVPEADARWLIGAQILADQARLEAELARTREQMAANEGRWSFCGIRFGVNA